MIENICNLTECTSWHSHRISFLSFWQFPKKFPYWHAKTLSWMSMRNLSLNSNTQGNCSVSCHTHSTNWVKTGDTSLGSPSKWPHLQTPTHVCNAAYFKSVIGAEGQCIPYTYLCVNLWPMEIHSFSINTLKKTAFNSGSTLVEVRVKIYKEVNKYGSTWVIRVLPNDWINYRSYWRSVGPALTIKPFMVR